MQKIIELEQKLKELRDKITIATKTQNRRLVIYEDDAEKLRLDIKQLKFETYGPVQKVYKKETVWWK